MFVRKRFITTSLSEMKYFGTFLFVFGIDIMFVMKYNGLWNGEYVL